MTSSAERQSTNLCRRLDLIDRSRMSFSECSRLVRAGSCGADAGARSGRLGRCFTPRRGSSALIGIGVQAQHNSAPSATASASSRIAAFPLFSSGTCEYPSLVPHAGSGSISPKIMSPSTSTSSAREIWCSRPSGMSSASLRSVCTIVQPLRAGGAACSPRGG